MKNGMNFKAKRVTKETREVKSEGDMKNGEAFIGKESDSGDNEIKSVRRCKEGQGFQSQEGRPEREKGDKK